MQPPRLPGYVAVSATMLRGAYAEEPAQREFYARLATLQPVATIGYSIFIFRVDRPWYLDTCVRDRNVSASHASR